jgi:peptidoglycan/xylan/chitin deacetylase (PgdA/CDA1 family)
MTVLCYHSLQPGWESPLATEPDDFAWQAAWLRRSRTVLPVREALPRLDRSGRLPRGEAALTFDDGFADLYTHGLPVLTRHRLPATVFLVAQTLTPAGQPVDWVRTAGSQELTTLTLDQVLEMQDAGIEFESHSWAHRDLIELSAAECVRDLRESRELLSDLLHRPVTLLAYPRGLHNEMVRLAAEKAGYTSAFALPERAEQPSAFAIPRVGIYRGNGPSTVRLKASRPYLRLRTSERVLRAAGPVTRLARRLRHPGA